MSMIGYKALYNDFTARNNFKYEIGKTYELSKDEKLTVCNCGFHFCKNPIDVYGYYENNSATIIVEVEALGKIIKEGTKYATDKIKINRVYSKEELDKLISKGIGNTLGDFNTGDYNSGRYNSGNYNSGLYNSGHHNTGNRNSGNYNSGCDNAGGGNIGYMNHGDCNVGHSNDGCYNIGSHNKGNYNTSNYNIGDYNAGPFNIGKYNAGWYNSGERNTGIFNTDEPLMRAFNKECNMRFSDFIDSLKYSFYDLCERIYNKKLMDDDRERIEALPNYDPEIFTEITGIKFDDEDNKAKETIAELNDEIDHLLEEIELKRKRINELKTKSN